MPFHLHLKLIFVRFFIIRHNILLILNPFPVLYLFVNLLTLAIYQRLFKLIKWAWDQVSLIRFFLNIYRTLINSMWIRYFFFYNTSWDCNWWCFSKKKEKERKNLFWYIKLNCNNHLYSNVLLGSVAQLTQSKNNLSLGRGTRTNGANYLVSFLPVAVFIMV